jgi:hypothetical protein
LQAFFAPKGARNNVANSGQMLAALYHSLLNVCSNARVSAGRRIGLDGRQFVGGCVP